MCPSPTSASPAEQILFTRCVFPRQAGITNQSSTREYFKLSPITRYCVEKGCVGQTQLLSAAVTSHNGLTVEVSALLCSSAPLPDSGNGDAQSHYPCQMLWGLWLKHCAVKILPPNPVLLYSLKTPGETQLLGRLRLQEVYSISGFSRRIPQGCF